MKLNFKFLFLVGTLFITAQNSFARVTNHIDSFETASGIIFGVDKYCKIERTNEYYTKGKFSVKLSFDTNDLDAVRNFFLPVVSTNKKNDESLLFDAYNKSGNDIILFHNIFFSSNKNVEVSTKLIKHKNTTVEIPFALVRTNTSTISGYRFYITNNTRNCAIYFDNFRTELSSYTPFKKIAYLDLAEDFLSTGIFFFSRGISGQVFKNTIPLPFEKINKINLFAAKGESIYYALSFRTDKKQDHVSVNLSNFISKETNKLSLTTSIGKVGFMDKKLSYDSKFYVADMPMYVKTGNTFSDLPARAARTFWLTLNIPETAESGEYNANINFESITGVITNKNTIPVSLDILPFSLNENLMNKNSVLNCDPENIKPETGRYVSGFFKEYSGSNDIVLTSTRKIQGGALDDFDGSEGDRTAVFPPNKISIAYYATCVGGNDLKYLSVLKELIDESESQSSQSNEIKTAEEDIKYLLKSLKTIPPLGVASKWTAMLTKEQVNLVGKFHDTNAVAFVTGEQKLPNGWSSKDYDRARKMLADDIVRLMKTSDTNLVLTNKPAKISCVESISIPLSRGKSKKKKSDTVYSVRELSSMTKVDGVVSENEWRNALKIKRFLKISGEGKDDAHTEARLGWYGSNFYVLVICYENNNNDLVELYIKPGNENKIWNRFSINSSGKEKNIKSDGKLCTQKINVQSAITNDCRYIEFEIPLTNCLVHSSDFGLNICRKNNENTFAWKRFNKNRLKFAHIKLDGAEKIVDALIDPIKKQPLKIISSDAFAIGKKDFISVETEWVGERRMLKKSRMKYKLVGNDGKEYIAFASKIPVSRQKVYLKLNNFVPGIYELYIILMDSNNEEISSVKAKIKII